MGGRSTSAGIAKWRNTDEQDLISFAAISDEPT
jgi:hypothetical protein